MNHIFTRCFIRLIPTDLLIYCLRFLNLDDIRCIAEVSKWWNAVISDESSLYWRETMNRWIYSRNLDISVCGRWNYLSQVRGRRKVEVALSELLKKFKSPSIRTGSNNYLIRNQISSRIDSRSLDFFFKYIHNNLWQNNDYGEIKPLPTICPTLALHLAKTSHSHVYFGDSCDEDISPPISAAMEFPVVFTGTFTQEFDLNSDIGNRIRGYKYCRSDWSFSLILEAADNSTPAELLLNDFETNEMFANRRKAVKAFCCWNKLSQRSVPTLPQLQEMPWNPFSDWILGLYEGIGKPAISVAEGFFQPDDGVLVLKATGASLIRPEHVYPNVPGKEGMLILFVDSAKNKANGIFTLNLADVSSGAGYFFLSRCPLNEWMCSPLRSELPSLPGLHSPTFPHETHLLPHVL